MKENDIKNIVSLKIAIELEKLNFNERTAYFYVRSTGRIIENTLMEDSIFDLAAIKNIHNIEYIKAPYKEQAERWLDENK